mmetsp:Transcript_39661/g.53939  ORF Transcript_39661/g.53939 Transcript_39661/m.53939 type:complete len:457 (-) Transcript_39661:225-1595(-)
MASLAVASDEVNSELLMCARYGEMEEMLAMLEAGADVNFKDANGSTALHNASANGNTECAERLIQAGAQHLCNESGNSPLQWASQGGKIDTVRLLLKAFPNIDVLSTNAAGMSSLSGAFQSGNTDLVALLLEQPSATEDKLLSPSKKKGGKQGSTNDAVSGGAADGPCPDDDDDDGAAPTEVTHSMKLGSGEDCPVVRIRELAIQHADQPFGASPIEDTTGLGIWCASLVLARWVAMDLAESLEGRVVCELGAGCGLPAISAAVHCAPSATFLTDLNPVALENMRFNVDQNMNDSSDSGGEAGELLSECGEKESESNSGPTRKATAQVLSLDWSEVPACAELNSGEGENCGRVDCVLGADLVYDKEAGDILARALVQLLKPSTGRFFYVAPTTRRAGLDDFLRDLEAVHGFRKIDESPAPAAYLDNPLVNKDDDAFLLHFTDLKVETFLLHQFQRR